MPIDKVRIVLEVPEILRFDLKRRALEKRMTLKNWILLAIKKALEEEKQSPGEL